MKNYNSIIKICNKCIFWKRWENNIDPNHGDCKKHSPIIVSDRDGEYSSIWPDTDGDDWCGSFQETETGY